MITQKYKYGDVEATLTWIPCTEEELAKYQPITQAYGVCVTEDKMIVIVNTPYGWSLPGGSPEPGESIRQTLERELMEEVDIKISDAKLLGVQRVEQEGKTFYQSRWVCKVSEIFPQTPDPAEGKIRERKMVPEDKILDYVKWGKIGEEIFRKSFQLVHFS